MDIIINGATRAGDFSTVSDLLDSEDLDPKLVVVELNGEILPESNFSSTRLTEGDKIEIVQFVAGG